MKHLLLLLLAVCALLHSGVVQADLGAPLHTEQDTPLDAVEDNGEVGQSEGESALNTEGETSLVGTDASVSVSEGAGARQALGMQSGGIRDEQITANIYNSYGHSNYLPTRARLGHNNGGWLGQNNKNDWIQVDFEGQVEVSGVTTQGHSSYRWYVKSYKVMYSVDGVTWKSVGGGSGKTFAGNNHHQWRTPRTNTFTGVKGRFFRIYTLSWSGNNALRFEFLGRRLSNLKLDHPIMSRMPWGFGYSNSIHGNNLYYSPRQWRLNNRQAAQSWCSYNNENGAFLEIDLRTNFTITAIATQGRGNHRQWVKSYNLRYSYDGVNWIDFKRQGESTISEWSGNDYSYASTKRHIFVKGFKARFVRLYPLKYYSHMSLRWELYGKAAGKMPKMGSALGMQSGRIKSDQIRTSGNHGNSAYYDGHQARLHNRNGAGSWCPTRAEQGSWLMVDFKGSVTVKTLVTQGRYNSNQWWTRYTMEYSNDGIKFEKYRVDGKVYEFRGNYDRHQVQYQILDKPVTARYIRLKVLKWVSFPSLRIEFLGHVNTRKKMPRALGMQSGAIPTAAITASSYHNYYLGPKHSRIHGNYAWCPRQSNRDDYLQIDLRADSHVGGIAIQGRHDANQYVKLFKLQYSTDMITWKDYKVGDNVKWFTGPHRHRDVVQHILDVPIRARGIRFQSQRNQYYGYPCMRVEVYGSRIKSLSIGKALGMQSRAITAGQISRGGAPGDPGTYYGINQAGLHQRGCRLPVNGKSRSWLQVDFRGLVVLNGLATQGEFNHGYWIKFYQLHYSNDAQSWKVYSSKDGTPMKFHGNVDYRGVVQHILQHPIKCRYVRIVMLEYQSHPTIRAEFYGTRLSALKLGKPLYQNYRNTGANMASSSRWDDWAAARKAALWENGGWIPTPSHNVFRKPRDNNWIQLKFPGIAEVDGVTVAPRYSSNAWVTKYTLSYSMDGVKFHDYRINGQVAIFHGPAARTTSKTQLFLEKIRCKYLRLTPRGYYNYIALRWEAYGKMLHHVKLGSALGIGNGAIPNKQLSASSYWYNFYHSPARSRLHSRTYGWCARHDKFRQGQAQWIQADLGKAKVIGGIATQGRYTYPAWVTKFKVKYSVDGSSWHNYMDNRVFMANGDRHTVVRHAFTQPFLARFVRLYPLGYYRMMCMRWELYGPARYGGRFADNIGKAIGIQNKLIPDRSLKANDACNAAGDARNARLGVTHGAGGWCPKNPAAKNNWLQIDNGKQIEFGGISTQSSQVKTGSVLGYQLKYSNDSFTWKTYKEGGVNHNFVGAVNTNAVQHGFHHPFLARYVRIVPRADPTQKEVYLRAELYTSARWEATRKDREAASKAKKLAVAKAREDKIKAAEDKAKANAQAAAAAEAAKIKAANAKLIAAQKSKNAGEIRRIRAQLAAAHAEAKKKAAEYAAKRAESEKALKELEAQKDQIKKNLEILRGHHRTIAVYNAKIANQKRRYQQAYSAYQRTRAKYVSIFRHQRAAINRLRYLLRVYRYHHADKSRKVADLKKYMDKREDQHESLIEQKEKAEEATNAARQRAAQALADKNEALHAANNETIVGLQKLEANLTNWLHVLETKPTYGEKYLTAPPHVHRSKHCIKHEDLEVRGKFKCVVENECDYPIFVTWTLSGLTGYEARKNKTPYSALLHPDKNAVLYGYGKCEELRVNSDPAPDGEHEDDFAAAEPEDNEEEHDGDEEDFEEDEE